MAQSYLDKTGLAALWAKIKNYVGDATDQSGPLSRHPVEEGLSNGWNYIKWSDGIMECWCRKIFGKAPEGNGIAITSGWNGHYYGNLGKLPDYPSTYLHYPEVQMTTQVTKGNAWATYNNQDFSYSNPGSIVLASFSSYEGNSTVGINATVNAHIIGKIPSNHIRVMQYNVGRWNYGNSTYGLPTSTYGEKVANMKNFFWEHDIDLLCMEEYYHYLDQSKTKDTNTTLFNKVELSNANDSNNGWSSIKSSYTLTGSTSGTYQSREYRYSKINIPAYDGKPAKTVGVLCVHLSNNTSTHAAEMQQMINILANDEYAIMCGDFNFTNEMRDQMYGIAVNAGYKLVNGGAIDWTPTWPADDPSWYIDNILVKGNIEIKNAGVQYVYDDMCSDHLPLVADLYIY